MLLKYIGEISGIATSCCWVLTALCFELAGKRIGSVAVNLIRLYIAFIIYVLFTWWYRGMILPFDASLHNWCWLTLSGLVGFSFGDYMLFWALTLLGARLSMLIMAAVPPITAIIGWLVLNESLSNTAILGMTVTLFGILLVLLNKKEGSKKLHITVPLLGLVCAVAGAIGQSGGLVLSKYGMKQYDAFAASHIRIIAAIISLSLFYLFNGGWKKVFASFADKRAMLFTTIGAVFGPFLGVALSLLSIQHAKLGIASTLMALGPVIIIAPAIFVFKERISYKEILGACIAVIGVAILFLDISW